MDIFNKIFTWISGKLEWIISAIVLMLPRSPFGFVTSSSDYSAWFGILNWFIPVYSFVAILQTWLTAITIWYVYQCFLRWAKVTE